MNVAWCDKIRGFEIFAFHGYLMQRQSDLGIWIPVLIRPFL